MVRNIAQIPVPHRLPRTALSVPLFLASLTVSVRAQDLPDTVDLGGIEVVVGSRAGVADPLTLPVPVDIYGAEEIARLGEVDLAEVLGRIAPSFNSARLSAGDGAALHVATLRGMNGDQVLVLVNGRRRHPVAFAKLLAAVGQGTTGTDLRAIPVHAIKRIEVLREGAASQYGSDAIAGVINIVLKDHADGVSSSSHLGRTSRGDGARLLTSANAGVPFADGFLNLTVEVARQGAANRAGEAPTCFGANPDYAPCADGGKTILLQRNGEPDYESAAFFGNAAIPVGESGEIYAFGGYSDREAVSDGLYRKADWVPRTVSHVYPDGFFPLEESEMDDGSAVAGVRGRSGRLVGRPEPRPRAGALRLRRRELDQSGVRGRVPGRQSGCRRGGHIRQRGAPGRLQRIAQRSPVDLERRRRARPRTGIHGRVPGRRGRIPPRLLLDGGR